MQTLRSKVRRLQRFMGERLECRNISRNSLHGVLPRHEILDRSAGAIEKERASTRHGKEGSPVRVPGEGSKHLQITISSCAPSSLDHSGGSPGNRAPA